MSATTQGARAFEHILWEASEISREVVTIASGNAITPGMVLGKITATGKYAPYDDNNTDGTQTAVAISCDAVDAATADKQALVTVRLAEVVASKLSWAATVAAGEKTTAYADLAAAFVIAR